jgi:RNA polymerase sigma factor (sigma-70 family)
VNSDISMAEFQALVEEHQERVRNLCFHFLRNLDDADDIAQEVFIQVYESLGHFREEAQLATWIHRITVNKCLDFLKAKKRKKRFAILTSLFGFSEEEEEVIPDPGENPHEKLEEKERVETLHAAINQLPENQKTALTLNKLEGMSNKEIAAIMDLTLSATDALLHRARKNLEKYLFSYYEKKLL